MATTFSQVLSEADIAYLLNLPEVQSAKVVVTLKEAGAVSFTISLTPTLKATLEERLSIDLSGVDSIPMRWIKGDTRPHVDTGVRTFTDTYLMYVTDSPGDFVVDGTSYPMTQGTAYRFHEGLEHKTMGTGDEPRLLLGPMSEAGFAVGIACGTPISVPGGTIIYIRQKPEEAAGINQYSTFPDIEESWLDIENYPICVENTDPDADFIRVIFLSDITLTDGEENAFNRYFICQSDRIQFGSEALINGGYLPIIDINNNSDNERYPGLIQNSGHSNIRIFNLKVRAGVDTYLSDGGGWVAQVNFGGSDNYIINCHSVGTISYDAGGIVGSGAANGGSLWVRGCSSSGDITDTNSGGIVGAACGQENGQITISSCWSTGNITGNGGGISGNNCNATIENCYSEGNIEGNGAGGIAGRNADGIATCQITGCYSRGAISGNNAGGIVGQIQATEGSNSYAITVTNCYSVGTINAVALAGGVIGPISGAGAWNITVNRCYTVGATNGTMSGYIIGDISIINANIGVTPQSISCDNNYSEAAAEFGNPGTWTSTTAAGTLEGRPEPKIGTTWVETSVDQPYELFNMGYTPYTAVNISTLDSSLVRTFSSTVSAGGTTDSGIIRSLLTSKDNITDNGFTIGETVDKDMINDTYIRSTDPNNYAAFFQGLGMASFTDGNIVAGDKADVDRLNASYWYNLDDDIFDGWGFFYIYDVESGKYYFPLIDPQNQDDGVLTTQTFNVFGREFTIRHGWCVQGIFKFDISVNDNKPFRFGAYGDMGYDAEPDISDLTHQYTLNGNSQTLYYKRLAQINQASEILYSYWIPKESGQNTGTPYDFLADTEDYNILMSKEINRGLIVYFGKTNDVKDWVVDDLTSSGCATSYQKLDITGGNPSSHGTITVNPCTGVISTTSSTVPGTYRLYIRSVGSYNITTYDLTVTEGSSCCVDSQQLIGLDYDTRNSILTGKLMIIRPSGMPMTYDELMRIRKARSSRR